MVSSAETGALGSTIELNAVQRSNPEMQKRVANTIRALVEQRKPYCSIHDHGAGGHLNCLSELVEDSEEPFADALPIGDPNCLPKKLSVMNLKSVWANYLKDTPRLEKIEEKKAPCYIVGEVTGDHRFSFHSDKTQETPIDLDLSALFGSSPKTIMRIKNKHLL